MTEDVITIAKGISDVGMMVIVCAIFLTLSAALMIACFRWFKAIINSMIDDNKSVMTELLDETRMQNAQLADISEGLRAETLLRIKNTANTFFDLSVERVCRMIKKVREENHIIDRMATRRKIHALIQNLHDDRNTRFDCYTYRGRKLSTYTADEWTDWVAEVVEGEVYNESINNGRAYTNVSAVYERIKLDFYHRLNS